MTVCWSLRGEPAIHAPRHSALRPHAAAASEEADPPEVALGERLFLETRFAQFFFAHSAGNANAQLPEGDPVLATTMTTNGTVTGPFAGQSMNCRVCHLVDESPGGKGIRTYNDFARRSPIPDRGDGKIETPRNSPPLVNASLPRSNAFFLHFDGEFPTSHDLVVATLTGRNYGWLASETVAAAHHVAHIIRDDDGTGDLAQQFGGAYSVVLDGSDPSIPPEFRLPEKYRIDVGGADDQQILNAIAALVQAYLDQLVLDQDAAGVFTGSPYDVFLRKNNLPRFPARGESDLQYARKLRTAINSLQFPSFVTGPGGGVRVVRPSFPFHTVNESVAAFNARVQAYLHPRPPRYVSDADKTFETHRQAFRFGPNELEGLKVFLSEPGLAKASGVSGVGNCIKCHAPPSFTDFSFHNTGATQEEYDSIHGKAAFAALQIPSFAERSQNFDAYLPATSTHPNATGRFRSVPSAAQPGYTDLGVWNIFGNPDAQDSQNGLRQILRLPDPSQTSVDTLSQTIALFKTPGLRDLGHSAPYLHTGRMDTIAQTVQFYRQFSDLARRGAVRNADPELKGINLDTFSAQTLSAFLRSLNADYN